MNPPMQCLACRREIDSWVVGDIPPGDAAMEHLQHCAQCRHHQAEAQLLRLLRAHRIPPAREDFANEAIRAAILRADGRRAGAGRMANWWGAVAAGVALMAVMLLALVASGPGSTSPDHSIAQIVMGPLQSKVVQVLIDSTDDRDSATITISLADNLELDGFPGERVIEWNTPLKAGKNLLALPLRLADGAPSHFDVAFTHGGVRKEVRIDVSVGEPAPAA